MLKKIFKKLTYANVAATAALIVALTGAIAYNHPVQAASTAGTWFIAGTFSDLPACTSCEVSLAPSGDSNMGATGKLVQPATLSQRTHHRQPLQRAHRNPTRAWHPQVLPDLAHRHLTLPQLRDHRHQHNLQQRNPDPEHRPGYQPLRRRSQHRQRPTHKAPTQLAGNPVEKTRTKRCS